MKLTRRLLTAGLLSIAALAPTSQVLADNELADQAVSLLQEHCLRCHGESFRGNPRLDFSNLSSLFEESVLVAGDPDASAIYQRVRDDEMPEDEPLADAEKSLLRRWIQAGAPLPSETDADPESSVRSPRSLEDEIAAIRRDLRNTSVTDHVYRRYLTIRPLHNDPRLSDTDLNRARAAIAKLINSVSVNATVTVPTPLDSDETLFRLDLRDYDWDAQTWAKLESTYPYGIRRESRADASPLDSKYQLAAAMGVRHLVLRGDWFVDTVARPSFYHRFLQLPNTAKELETRLGVAAASDVRQFRVARAGFATSGVSIGHRLLQRHPSRDGAYWQSFDFGESNSQGNLFQRPFGPPQFEGTDPQDAKADLAFQHDGGEMIFSLPNGLQGYFLTDAKGNRLDRGPITVVRDDRQTGGTAEVVNAISCLNCHARGLIDFQDTVRTGHVLTGRFRRDVERLYPTAEQMQRLVNQDRQRFAQAADRAMGKWGTPTDELDASSEPIGWLVRWYGRDLDLTTAAAEVGISADRLRTMIELNPELQTLGLRPLIQGERIKRAAWSSREAFISPLQQTIRIANLGIPNN